MECNNLEASLNKIPHFFLEVTKSSRLFLKVVYNLPDNFFKMNKEN